MLNSNLKKEKAPKLTTARLKESAFDLKKDSYLKSTLLRILHLFAVFPLTDPGSVNSAYSLGLSAGHMLSYCAQLFYIKSLMSS